MENPNNETLSAREATLTDILHHHEEALSKLGAVFLGHQPDDAELVALAAAFRAGMKVTSLRPVIRKGGLFRSATVENKGSWR